MQEPHFLPPQGEIAGHLPKRIAMCQAKPPQRGFCDSGTFTMEDAVTFEIKSLLVQNLFMGFALAAVLFFLLRGVAKRNMLHVAVFSGWLLLVVWFFNSPFWGFSGVNLGRNGIEVHYGFLSLREQSLALNATCREVETRSGIMRTKTLYHLRLDGHRSMKVEADERKRLQAIIRALRKRREGGGG
jgi:hypothetical protein